MSKKNTGVQLVSNNTGRSLQALKKTFQKKSVKAYKLT